MENKNQQEYGGENRVHLKSKINAMKAGVTTRTLEDFLGS